ncbi:MAG: hypothetical protein OXI73_09395 [Rhodospirillales bacterium]|nr:hypothetical protein [Rhodospirillales bacterium]
MPTLYVVAGPNGCGKSTLTRTVWRGEVEIIDPDAIALRLPDGPGQAAREAVRRRRAALRADRAHLLETTLAGSGVLRHMDTARMARYRIELHYMCLESPDLALCRIRNRVALGGHDVPEPDARRRFARSLANLPAAIALADAVRLYDNTDHDRPHREVAVHAEASWWTAKQLPTWADAAIARVTTLSP